MTTISHKLSTDLKAGLKSADEVWVAVGLLNYTGLEFIVPLVGVITVPVALFFSLATTYPSL